MEGTRAVKMRVVAFTRDPQRGVSAHRCDACGAEYRVVSGFVYREGDAFAVYKAALHNHDGHNEAWTDVILGSWDEGDDASHVTFGCRIGPFGAAGEYACSLVAAAVPYGEAPIFGRKLDRDEALGHPWLGDFWQVVDFLLVDDPDLNTHVRLD